jgi:hypothetical protein
MRTGNTLLHLYSAQISDVCCRNALTGFRSGWRAATPSTSAINSNTEPAAQVDHFNYAADVSEDDTKEATLASMSIRKPTKDEPKVRSTEF